jgi:hypothetical protein
MQKEVLVHIEFAFDCKRKFLLHCAKALEESKEIQAPVKRQGLLNYVAMKAYKKLVMEPDERKKSKQYLKIVDK